MRIFRTCISIVPLLGLVSIITAGSWESEKITDGIDHLDLEGHDNAGFIVHTIGDSLSDPFVYAFYVIADPHIGGVDAYKDYNKESPIPDLSLETHFQSTNTQGALFSQGETDADTQQYYPCCCLIGTPLSSPLYQGGAAFGGGHLTGWVVSSTIGSVLERDIVLFWPVSAWLSSIFFQGAYSVQRLFLATWNYVGMPIGATLGTMWAGNTVRPGGKWSYTTLGALTGTAASFIIAQTYCLVFGDPWAYGPQGGPAPTDKTVGPFIWGVLPVASTLPAIGAVIGYNMSVPETEEFDMGMSYERSWTEKALLDLEREYSSSRSNEPRIELTLLRVSF